MDCPLILCGRKSGLRKEENWKQLEEENRRLKQLVADLSLAKSMLQDALKGKL